MEQKLALEVLGVKGANGWRDSGEQAARSRWHGPVRRAYSPPNNQAVFKMKLTLKNNSFPGGALAPEESRFEMPEIGPLRETAVCAHFGRKLQKIFPLPSGNSEPENVRILLRKIQATLNKFPVPGDR